MARLPARYSPFLFAVFQAGLTTGLATALATAQAMPFGPQFWTHWLESWVLAWAVMVPLVIAAAPLIQRTVRRLTSREPHAPGE